MIDISVVMPVYNGETYLAEAINSILSQTLDNFEFIIVCENGTSEESTEIVKNFCKKDDRIMPIFNDEHLGISESLNVGMRNAKGKYIARMDADDISGKRRFEVQKEFMDTYPNIGICGTKHSVIGAPHWLVDYHADPVQIKSELLFFVPLRHPTIMIRKSMIEQNQLYYDPNIPGAEDYDFLIRASRVTKLSNIMDKELFAYRRAAGNVSALNIDRDVKIRQSLTKRLFADELQLAFEDDEIDNLSITHKYENKSEIINLDLALNKIVEQNNILKVYDESALRNTMFHRWSRVKYAIDLQYKKTPPKGMLDCWKDGTFYRNWME